MLGWSFFSTVQDVNTRVGWENAEEERTLRNCAAEVNIVEVHAYLVGEPPRACMRMRCVSIRHEQAISQENAPGMRIAPACRYNWPSAPSIISARSS